MLQILLRGLALGVLVFLPACSGTPSAEKDNGIVPSDTQLAVPETSGADTNPDTNPAPVDGAVEMDAAEDTNPPCVGSCAGVVCGDDGCGGSCGSCSVGEACVAGACNPAPCGADPSCECMLETCVPEHESQGPAFISATCNSNMQGCQAHLAEDFGGGSCEAVTCTLCFQHHQQCGTWANNYLQNGGFCEGCTCPAKCTGRVCGDDGCGGSCGECGDQELCTWGGQCIPCTAQCDGKNCGYDQCNGVCGTCEGEATCTKGNCGPQLSCGELPACFQGCDSMECDSDCLDSASPSATIAYEHMSSCRSANCGDIFDPSDYFKCMTEYCWVEFTLCFDGTEGTLTCGEISACVLACGDSACQNQCVVNGTPESANEYMTLSVCTLEACGKTPTAACLAGAVAPGGACGDLYAACQAP